MAHLRDTFAARRAGAPMRYEVLSLMHGRNFSVQQDFGRRKAECHRTPEKWDGVR